MGLWEKIRNAVIKPDVEVNTTDDEEFISTSPYPKPDAHGEPGAPPADAPAEGEGAP